MEINPTIFREYDIRGRVDRPDELTDDAVRAIGGAFAAFLIRRGIGRAVVGRDARLHSRKVSELTIHALLESGVGVIEIGEVLTPIFYFAQHHLREKGGVMITASHNAGQWSGFKHAYDYSTTLLPHEVKEIQEIAVRGDFKTGVGKHQVVSTADIVEAYAKDALQSVELARPLRVVVDTANGTAGPIVPAILRRAGCEVIEQYTDVREDRDHDANPSNLDMLEAMSRGVRAHEADIGLGFDEDGDRLGAVDERGEIIWPDRILILLARSELQKKPGGSVVFDVKCTEALVDDLKAHGGIPVMWKTGHSHIKAKAKEVGAILAGERSGHIFFPEHYGFDDAAFAALKFLEHISRERGSVSQIMTGLPQYITSPVWHAPCPDTEKYRVVEALTAQFKQELGEERVVEINGARVYFDSGWGLIRASSNVPALVVVFESKTEEGLNKIESALREKLADFPEVEDHWVSG